MFSWGIERKRTEALPSPYPPFSAFAESHIVVCEQEKTRALAKISDDLSVLRHFFMKAVVFIISEGKHYFSFSDSSGDFSVTRMSTWWRHASEERVSVAHTFTELWSWRQENSMATGMRSWQLTPGTTGMRREQTCNGTWLLRPQSPLPVIYFFWKVCTFKRNQSAPQ